MLDDAEQRLRHARSHAADARRAPADDAVGGGRDLRIVAAPLQLAPLRLDLGLLGLRELQPVARGDELGLPLLAANSR